MHGIAEYKADPVDVESTRGGPCLVPVNADSLGNVGLVRGYVPRHFNNQRFLGHCERVRNELNVVALPAEDMM